MDVSLKSTVQNRHLTLDALRGIAALFVVIYHGLYYRYGIHIESMGTFTVYLFFALSALTMMMVYGDRTGSAAKFYIARATRIMPLLILVSLILIVVSRFHPEVVGRGLATATGLFAVAPGVLSVGNGAWSLGIEIVFYALFPVIALRSWRVSVPMLFTILAGSVIIQQALVTAISGYEESTFWALYTVPMTFAPFFVIGFIVHRLPRASLSPALFVGALAVLAFASLAFGPVVRNPPAYLALTALSGLTLWLAFNARIVRFRPVAAFFGDVSYSLYLTHWFAFVAVRRVDLEPALFWPAYLATALIGAWLCFHLFERPARDWLRGRLLGAHSRAPRVGASTIVR